MHVRAKMKANSLSPLSKGLFLIGILPRLTNLSRKINQPMSNAQFRRNLSNMLFRRILSLEQFIILLQLQLSLVCNVTVVS